MKRPTRVPASTVATAIMAAGLAPYAPAFARGVWIAAASVHLLFAFLILRRWFTERRGLGVGLFAASTATGQLIFLPLAAWMIEHLGWRFAVIPVFVA